MNTIKLVLKGLVITCFTLININVIAQQKTNKMVASNTKGYHIKVKLTPVKQAKLFLGCYYGKNHLLLDSTYLDNNSQASFINKEKSLVQGVYFLVSDKKVMLYEFLVGDQQHFSIEADTSNIRLSAKVIGSPDNDLFKSYSTKMYQMGTSLNSLAASLPKAKTSTDSASIYEKIKVENKQIEAYRNAIINQNSSSLLAVLLNAMKRPTSPALSKKSSKTDSLNAYYFVKEHFWDDVIFADERLLRTPFFNGKIDEYYKYYVSVDADSIIPEVKTMLISSRSNSEMYSFLLTKFTNKYLYPEYMGQDKVFTYLFSNHYLKGDTTYLDVKSRKTLIERGYSLLANQINSPAPQLTLTDTNNVVHNLYSIKAKYTVVVFWDPNCGHCKDEIPLIDSLYRTVWKNFDVSVYSVNIKENAVKEWKQFLKEKNISSTWHQVYQTKEAMLLEQQASIPNYRQLFDVNKTPTVYLLNKNKEIIAKQLTPHQLTEVMKKTTN